MIIGNDAGFRMLTEKITRDRGFRCASYKDKCLRRRIAVRMRAKNTSSTIEYASILDTDPREYDRLLMGGVWAEIKLRYDDAYVFKGQNRPFFVESIRPIQLSTRNIERFIEVANLRVAQGAGSDCGVCRRTDLPRWNGAPAVRVERLRVVAELGFCVGCQIFAVLMRIGVIPESVCEECSNLGWGPKAVLS